MKYYKFTYGSSNPEVEETEYFAFDNEKIDQSFIKELEYDFLFKLLDEYGYLSTLKEALCSNEVDKYEAAKKSFLSNCYSYSERITEEEYKAVEEDSYD